MKAPDLIAILTKRGITALVWVRPNVQPFLMFLGFGWTKRQESDNRLALRDDAN